MIKKDLISCLTALTLCTFLTCFNAVNVFADTTSNSGTTTGSAINVTDTFSLSSYSIKDGAQDVPVAASLVLTFNKPLNRDMVDINSVFIRDDGQKKVSSTYTLSMDSKTLTIKPNSKLSEKSQYTIVITTDLIDTDGESLSDQAEWSFTTGKDVPKADVIPDKPTGLRGVAQSASSVKWSWNASQNADGYVVKDENGNIIGTVDRYTSTEYIENKLTPGMKYKRTVAAYTINELGEKIYSNDSIAVSSTTKSFKMKAPVVFTKIEEVTSEQITWRLIYRSLESGLKLNVYDGDGNVIASQQPVENKTYIENTDLSKNTKQVVRKFSFFDPNLGIESDRVTVSIPNPYYTEGGKSLNAPKVKAGTFINNSVEIIIKDKSRDEDGFKIFETDALGNIIDVAKNSDDPAIQLVPTGDKSNINGTIKATIINLDSSTVYHFIVKAYSATLGEGEASDMITVNETK